MNRILTKEIYRNECVGDSVSKHNYNIMSLDTNICNLSSQYFTSKNNYYQVFSDFISNSALFMQMYNLFYDPTRYNMATATVNILSSYWAKHEFSVHYPLNISTLNNMSIKCPTINQVDSNLISLAKSYLKTNYPASNYDTNTYVNVIFFLYNVPSNPSNPNNLISKSLSPEISYNVRNMQVSFLKTDVHLKNGKILKFSNDGLGNWIYFSTEDGTDDGITQPSLKKSVFSRNITQSTISQSITSNGRSVINLTIDSNTYNYDILYNASMTGLYYPGYTDVTLTINSGVYVGSTTITDKAISVSGFTTGDTVNIVNNGNILGCGGAGGVGQNLGNQLSNANNGGDGGDAILLSYPTTIKNNGLIAGGGGGGAGGKATASDTSYAKYANKNQNVSIVTDSPGGGGGGGAGYDGGIIGNAGTYTALPTPPNKKPKFIIGNASSGNAGGLTIGGIGGTGAYRGGKGGDIGQDGTSTGTIDSKKKQLPPLGGKAGNYLNGKSYATWLQTGDVRGKLA
jgi:hypothetical protein